MTYKEAIATLQIYDDLVIGNDNSGVDVAIKKAVEALEKQIQKKPLITNKLNWLVCPNCQTFIHADNLYCKRCGQAIDWSEK